MIDQITPLVKEAGIRTWLSAATSHLVGSAFSGGLLGFVLGTVGLAIGLGRWKSIAGDLVALVLLLAALRDAGIVKLSLPSLKRQTPVWFPRVFGTRMGTFAWGLDLGQGWTTLISFTGYYALIVIALLNASPIQGALILCVYGLGRALPVILAGLNSQSDVSVLAHWYLLRQTILYRLNAAGLAFIVGYLLAR